MSTEQLEELDTPEIDEAEEEEIEHPYLDTIEMMDKTDRMNKLRSLIKFSKSKDWKKVKEWAKSREDIIKEQIREEAYNRVKNEKVASVIDERVLYVKVLTQIAEQVDNEVFKDYLLKYQVNAYDSFVINKTGHIFLSLGTEGEDFNAVPVLVDEPIYSALDILKKSKAIYHSTGRLLAYCIDTYDTEKLLQKKEEVQENRHQPY